MASSITSTIATTVLWSAAVVKATQAGSTSKASSSTSSSPTDDQLKNAKSALEKIKQATKAQRDSAKSMASLRLEWVRQQLMLLRQFGGDPKVMARELARLGKEIAGAVSMYAGKSSASAEAIQDMGSAASISEASSDSVSGSALSASVSPPLMSETAEQTVAAPIASSDAGVSTDFTTATSSSSADEANSLSSSASTKITASDISGQQDRAGPKDASSSSQTNSNGNEADRKFLELARSLLKELKALIARERFRHPDEEGLIDAVKAAQGAADAIVEAAPVLEPSIVIQA